MSGGDRKRAEFLAWVFADFRRFAGIVDIVGKGGMRQKLTLNRIQRLYCKNRTQRDVVLKARQMGFTTLEQVRDVFYFLTVPGARVVVTCQSVTDHGPAKQLAANFRVIFDSLARAGVSLKFRSDAFGEWVLADRDATLRIVEAGASQAAASKKGRAGTISRLHLTETAFYEYADDTLNAMLECVPSIAHGSEIVNESTPNGATGFFYRQCKSAATHAGAYQLHFYPWYDALEYSTPLDEGEIIEPRDKREHLLIERGITREQLKWYRAKVEDKGQDKTDQEYPSDPETCFLVSGRSFFELGVTNRLIEEWSSEPVDTRDKDRVRIWLPPEKGKRYIVSADTSEGSGSDPSAAVVREFATGDHCATLSGQYPPEDLAGATAALGLEYNTAEIAVERNNHGHTTLVVLRREQKYPRIYYHRDKKAGFPTDQVTRPVMLDGLAAAHRKGLWKCRDRATLAQFRTFIVNAQGRPEAAPGEHDDLVMAEAVGWEVRQAVPAKVPGGGRVETGVSYEESSVGF
jgi:hypothetical protein